MTGMPAQFKPLISVVIPCFNAERYIVATLRSVQAQTWPALDVMVIDDGSSDQSAERVRSQFPSVRVIQQANKGVAAARNLGMQQARGEWIAFLDADDIWLPDKLERQWALLQAHPDARMSYTAWKIWQSEEPTPSQALLSQLQADASNSAHWAGASGWIYADLLLDCVVWTSTVLAHVSIFEEIGSFDVGMRIGEDYDLWLRASRVTPILRVTAPLALYRTHAASITKSAPLKNYKGLVIQRALDRWALVSPDGRLANRGDVHGVLARTWSDFAIDSLAAGRRDQAWHGAVQSVKTDWRQAAGWKAALKILLWRRPHPQ